MPDYIVDNTDLPFPKADYRSRPDIATDKQVTAADWNAVCQALEDAKDNFRGLVFNAKHYGAKGDGVADDTAAINAAAAAAETARVAGGSTVLGVKVYLPRGAYRVTSTLTLASYVTLQGESRYNTTLRWSGSAAVGARMFEFVNKYGVGFQDIRISIDAIVASPNTIAVFYMSNCFRFTWQRVIVGGNHAASADPQSTGFEFRDNTGDSRIIDCDINNLGVGVRTSSIQNYVVGSVFGNNKYSVYGDAGTFSAGLICQSCTFVGTGADAAPGRTEAHIIVDRSANMWRIIGCWMEGCRKGVVIGAAAGGPTEFGIIGCKIAAVDTAIEVRNTTLPTLMNITLNVDGTGTPVGSYVDLDINATDAPNGTAIGIRAGSAFDLDPAAFPPGWTVMRRGAMRLPNVIDVTDPVTFSGDSAITIDSTAAPGFIFGANIAEVRLSNANVNFRSVGASGNVYIKSNGGRLYLNPTAGNGDIDACAGGGDLLLNGDLVVIGKTVRLTGELVPPQITANQNDYSPTGMADAVTLLINSDAARDITGFATPTTGRLLWVYNTGAFNVTLKHQVTSSAGNQIRGRGGADTVLTPSTGVQLYYSPSLTKWVVMTDTL